MPVELELKPLDGTTVVDLTGNIAGPFATLVLHDLGARVIKVEPPNGDVSRQWWPNSGGTSTVFASMNRGKESVIVDAKKPEGRSVLLELVEEADVFVESMRPGKAEALGLGWSDLKVCNDRLVYCSINAFGSSGPMAGMPGFDAIIQAYSGLMDLTGYPDAPPSRVGGAIVDVGTGLWAALSVVTALMQRSKDGKGRFVMATLLGTAVAYLMHHLTSVDAAGVVPKRIGTAQHNFAPYQAVKARDRLVMVGVSSDEMWARMAQALGRSELAEDPRFSTNGSRIENKDELIAQINASIEDLTADAVMARLVEVGVPASVVRPIEDVVADPQLEAIGLWGRTPTGQRLPRIPIQDRGERLGAVAKPGEHTRTILAEIGRTADQAQTMIDEGIVEAGSWEPTI